MTWLDGSYMVRKGEARGRPGKTQFMVEMGAAEKDEIRGTGGHESSLFRHRAAG